MSPVNSSFLLAQYVFLSPPGPEPLFLQGQGRGRGTTVQVLFLLVLALGLHAVVLRDHSREHVVCVGEHRLKPSPVPAKHAFTQPGPSLGPCVLVL